MPSDELNERRVEIARPPILLAGRADRANRDEYAPGPGQGLGNDPQGYAHADVIRAALRLTAAGTGG
jgi:hypothetical protein